jgi:cytoskeletal protein RodZ
MDELGHILREARENKGLTLAQVQSEIRINSKFLAALETGEYHRLPTPVHVRGFLRNYARFLGLDPQPLLDRYEVRQKEKPALRHQKPCAKTPFYQPRLFNREQPFLTRLTLKSMPAIKPAVLTHRRCPPHHYRRPANCRGSCLQSLPAPDYQW